MNDAYKHLRKKGMSYKDKKDFLKSIPKSTFCTPESALALPISNINDDVDLSALNFVASQILAIGVLRHHLKNDVEFNKFLQELKQEENLKK
jgi:hypothetical protein